jgi:hypothetical protein
LLSDGASRLVDLFELATWEELLALLDASAPMSCSARSGPPKPSIPRPAMAQDQTQRRRHRVYLVLDETTSIQP